MDKQTTETSDSRFFYFEKQVFTIGDFESSGYILDIGGGGEGIIGILKGKDVIAIDLKKEEFKEAADGPLKIIMDARELQFLDDTFNTVTAFFSLMYLKNRSDYEKVFNGVFRVLKSGGQFLIWEISVPQRFKDASDIYVVPLVVRVKDKEIETGYGQSWPDEKHDMGFYLDLAKRSGFDVIEQKENGKIIILQLKKP
jgi:ubiquinone/menaquinone biosynthesis C-methylase UbiE